MGRIARTNAFEVSHDSGEQIYYELLAKRSSYFFELLLVL